MRVLITRPEREAVTLATALRERGHETVIAPLFRLAFVHPTAEFQAALAACQAVLLSSANGARALAEASEQRSKPIFAVGDTTAATAEGLGFTSVMSASGDGAALAELVRQRLDPKDGPLVHVSGVDVAGDLAPEGFEVRRFALYEAREADALPDSARAALQARALDAAPVFSPRSAALFARLVNEAGLADACKNIAAVAISPAAARPLSALPFRSTVAAPRPTRQAVLDEIDHLPLPGVQGPGVQEPETMSDTPPPSPPPAPPPVQVRRGLGFIGAFVTGVIAAAIVLVAAVASLPYWPEEARLLWRGPVAAAPPPPVTVSKPVLDTAALDAAKRDLNQRLDDLDKRVRAAATTAAQADRPQTPDPAIAELKGRIDALENKPAPAPAAAPSGESEKEVAALKDEIASLRTALQSLDGSVDKMKAATSANGAADQQAVAAARDSAVVGVAARLSAALDSGQPFASTLALLQPLIQGDAKLGELSGALQPLAQTGVASVGTLAAEFPAVAKTALADDLADDSFGERLLGKIRGLVSLRRVGADVQGDTVEAKLARAEAALDGGDLAKAVELVKSLPAQTSRATSAWLARAEAHLSAQRTIDQIAAHAVSLLGAAR